MSALFAEQQALLAHQLQVLARLELIQLIRSSVDTLAGIMRRFATACRGSGLLPAGC